MMSNCLKKLVTFVIIITLALSEEKSILDDAELLPSSNLDLVQSQGNNALIDGSFKTAIQTEAIASPNIIIDLKKNILLKGALYVNNAQAENINRVNGKVSLSASQSGTDADQVCASSIYDTGFLPFTCPGQTNIKNEIEGYQYFRVERDAPVAGLLLEYMRMNELRLYQTPNLIFHKKDQIIVTAPSSINISKKVENLVQNQAQRSSSTEYGSLTDTSGSISTGNSCYTTASLSFTDQKLVMTFDLTESFFQHAIVVVQNIVDVLGEEKLQNFEVHVGQSTDYSLNAKCPNGPFMRVGEASSSTTYGINTLWNYGREIWCNLEGRYTTIVADFSGVPGNYNVSICNFAIMGTKYGRTASFTPSLNVLDGTVGLLSIPKIEAQAPLEIGNKLQICMRQQGTVLPWLTISCESADESVRIVVNPVGVVVQAYAVTLESFDQNSSVMSTLASDTITITVEAKQCNSQIVPAFVTYSAVDVIDWYEPTIFYPKYLFDNPLSLLAPGACSGTYTQEMSVPTNFAHLIDVVNHGPGDSDHSSIKIKRPTTAATSNKYSFLLTFKGTYTPDGTTTVLTNTFKQKYEVYVTEAYTNSVLITHAAYQFETKPGSESNLIDASSITVQYGWNADLETFKGKTPGPINNMLHTALPYEGFTDADAYITLGQDDSLGSAYLDHPQGVMQASPNVSVGQIVPGQQLTFTCAPWDATTQGQTIWKSQLFTNTAIEDLDSIILYECVYPINPPFAFKDDVPAITVTIGQKQSWELPEVETGFLTLKQIKFEPDSLLASYLTFDEASRIISYNGDPTVIALNGQTLNIEITLVDEIDRETQYSLVFTLVPCPITQHDFDQASQFMATQVVEMTITAEQENSVKSDYKLAYNTLIGTLRFDEQAKQLCSADIQIKFNSDYAFLASDVLSQSLILTSDKTSIEGSFNDAFIEFSLLHHTWKLPIKINFVPCQLTSLGFESDEASLTYKIGTGNAVMFLKAVVQEPNCGFHFTKFKIKSITSSTIAASQAETAVMFNQAAKVLMVETDDITFAGASIEVLISIDQNNMVDAKDFLAIIKFEAEAPSFDMSEFISPPILCSSANVGLWSVRVPPILGVDAKSQADVVVKLDETAPSSKYFLLSQDQITLEPETVVALAQGEWCPPEDKLEIVIKLVTKFQGKIRQTLEIPVSLNDESTQGEDEISDVARIFGEQNLQNDTVDDKETNQTVTVQTIEEAEEKLEVSRIKVSPTSELTLFFSKPILPLPIATEKASRRNLQQVSSISSAVSLSILDDDDQDEIDKSIVDVKLTAQTETSVSIQVTFNDTSAITETIREPDTLLVRIVLPRIFIDARTGEPLDTQPIEFKVLLGAQLTKEEYEVVKSKAKVAEQMSLAFSLWELLFITIFKKVLFSMWILILTLQFFVYIALWQVRYPSTLHFIMYELKRIALGEFLDDFDIAGYFMHELGIETNESSSSEEKVKENRLGSQNVFSSFGATFLAAFLIFAFFILLIIVVVILARRVTCSEKCRGRVNNLKQKVFYNPVIRYIILNSLKFNMSGIMAISAFMTGEEPSISNMLVGVAIITLTNLVVPIVFGIILYRNREVLNSYDAKKTYGAIYYGKNVTDKDHKAGQHAFVFFFRRCLFVVVTVYLFQQPLLQMYAHHFLTIFTAISLLQNTRTYVDKGQRLIEIGSEVFLHMTCIFLSQFMVSDYSKEMQGEIEKFTLVSFSMLLLLNFFYIVWSSVQICKEKLKRKAMEKLRQAQIEKMQKDRKELGKMRIKQVLETIPEESSQPSASSKSIVNNSSIPEASDQPQVLRMLSMSSLSASIPSQVPRKKLANNLSLFEETKEEQLFTGPVEVSELGSSSGISLESLDPSDRSAKVAAIAQRHPWMQTTLPITISFPNPIERPLTAPRQLVSGAKKLQTQTYSVSSMSSSSYPASLKE